MVLTVKCSNQFGPLLGPFTMHMFYIEVVVFVDFKSKMIFNPGEPFRMGRRIIQRQKRVVPTSLCGQTSKNY
ncbi:hypothetical protein HanIR_Chr08g0379131 [Helianthus annuus]|nr:hypothetical protein HanIR_Chr08g0379131 [Helianthus annuus]